MSCTYHIHNQVQFICIASHKCQYQRKLCQDCIYDHEGDNKQTIPIKRFQEMARKKIQDSSMNDPYIAKQKVAFKSMISQTENMLKIIWLELSEEIKQIYDQIDLENYNYKNLVNDNLAELSYTDIENLVQIFNGTTQNLQSDEKNQKIMELEKNKKRWEEEVQAFVEKTDEIIKKLKSLNKQQIQVKQKQQEKGKQIKVTRVDWKEGVKELRKLEGHNDCINSICFSPDGTTLASGSDDNSIRLWDVKTGQQKAKLNGHSDYVLSVCFLPDGTTLASGSVDNSIRLWDVKTGQQKALLDGHSNTVFSVCLSSDGTTLASGSGDNSIRLWDVKTRQQKAILDGHTNWVQSICFSPDGTILASGSGDNSIRLWDVKTGQQKVKLDGHTSAVWSVCFSPDGTILASGSSDTSIRLWDVKKGQQKARLDGHQQQVNSVCFSPDGTILASGSGSDDKSIRLWDVKTGQQKVKLNGHISAVWSVCFSPGGTILASGSGCKQIRLWGPKVNKMSQQY